MQLLVQLVRHSDQLFHQPDSPLDACRRGNFHVKTVRRHGNRVHAVVDEVGVGGVDSADELVFEGVEHGD